MSTDLIPTSEVLTPSGHKNFAERMQVLKQISDVTGIRLPNTIVPEGESLIPYGVERQRQLKEDIYSLPTVNEAVSALHDLRAEQAPRNTTLQLSRVRMNERTGGIFDAGESQRPGLEVIPMAEQQTSFEAPTADPENGSRLDAARVTLQWTDAMRPKAPQRDIEDLPLFGGERQGKLL